MLPTTELNLECFFPADDIDVKLDLSRAIVEEQCKPIGADLQGLVKTALEKAGKAWTDVRGGRDDS